MRMMELLPDRPRRSLLTLTVSTMLWGVLPGAAGAESAPVHLTGDFATAIVIDAGTGLTLMSTDENVKRQPASMLKMMTELIVLERIAEGDLSLTEVIPVSAKASRMGGSQVYLKHGEEFSIEELLKALAVHSANDAAATLAEYVAGSTDAFVDLMNVRAREMGMTNTVFHSVHGLPAGKGQSPDITTARDLATLARELVRYPQALEWASMETAPFRDGSFTLYNPNKLVGKYRGLDGLKTGYTEPAGFCVTATAVQKGTRLISVVMGCPTDKGRANETARLLSYGFNLYKQVTVIKQTGEPLAEPLHLKGGKQKTVAVAFGGDLEVSVPRDRENELELEIQVPAEFAAPVAAGAEVGRAAVKLDGIELGSVPILTLEAVEKGNWFNRLMK